MGKRKTAKTGDRALYKQRNVTTKEASDSDDDPVYTKVDRFHNRRDEEFLKLEKESDESSEEEDDGITGKQEAIMDLGGGKSSSDEESSSESSSDEDEPSAEKSPAEELSEASSDDEDMEMEDVRDWGAKKSSYYHGDTADLEIGQDEEDAFLEEKAAQEVKAARLQDMTEEDFLLSDTEEGKQDETKEVLETTVRDITKLSTKDKVKFLRSRHPELLPILSYFTDVVKELRDRTRVAARALFCGEEGTAEAVGATDSGQAYLLTKSLLQSSAALNVAMYLILKSEEASSANPTTESTSSIIQSHPVTSRLNQLNSLAQKLEDRVEKRTDALSDQLDKLVSAVAMMENGDDVSGSKDSSSSSDSEESAIEVKEEADKKAEEEHAHNSHEPSGSSDEDEEDVNRNILNDAQFGLRPQEVGGTQQTRRQRRPVPFDSDVLDDAGNGFEMASRTLAATLNTIHQKSTKNKASKQQVEDMDEAEVDDQLKQGLEMMEAELGRVDSDEDASDNEDVGRDGDEQAGDDGDFYSRVKQKTITKKRRKKELYEVSPKFPRMDQEIEGERPIGRTIFRNRGLVAHKSKLNRNPRVKKREQYRKALIRRKGSVREVRTNEAHKYGGEETGIKSRLSRSRKLVKR